MSMMIFRTDNPSSCGIVELNNDGVVVDFHEKVETYHGNLANGAVYILSADMLAILASSYSEAKNFSTDILNKFIGKIYTYETKEIFIDIGTPETYRRANSQ